MATVLDTRVVCLRPTLTNVSYEFLTGNRENHVLGLVAMEENLKPLGLIQNREPIGFGPKNFSMPFDCLFGLSLRDVRRSAYIDMEEWPVSV